MQDAIATEFMKLIRRKKKFALLVLGDDESHRLANSRNGFKKFTISRQHEEFSGLTFPAVVLIDTTIRGKPSCLLGTAENRRSVTTLETSITVRALGQVQRRVAEMAEVLGPRLRRIFEDSAPNGYGICRLTPRVAEELGKEILADEENSTVVAQVLIQLKPENSQTDMIWSLQDATSTCMKFADITHRDQLTLQVTRRGHHPVVSEVGGIHADSEFVGNDNDIRLMEDNVIRFDQLHLEGLGEARLQVTGQAVFQEGNARLTIYHANTGKLEEMLGVDLIYYNEITRGFVLVQYKMLEMVDQKRPGEDWVYRPNSDANFLVELQKMLLPPTQDKDESYRLGGPFYFRFVRRALHSERPTSFILSKEHLQKHISSAKALSPRGAVRLGYNSLGGCYLRPSDFVPLVKSGYIGSTASQARLMRPFIEGAVKGSKSVVVAWHEYIDKELTSNA